MECQFLSTDELNSLIAQGWTKVGGPFPDADTCAANCGSSTSSVSVSIASSSKISSSLLSSSSKVISSLSSLSSVPSSLPSSSIVSAKSSSSQPSSAASSAKSSSSAIVAASSTSSAKSSSAAPVSSVASKASSSSKKSSVTLVSSKSFSPQSSDSSFGPLAPACQNQTCVNDPRYNNDPTAGPLGIRWPIRTFLHITNYTPDANCPYFPDGTVIPLVYDPNVPNNFAGLGAWFSDVYTCTGQITQLNAGVLPGMRYGSFDRVFPVNGPPIRFQVTCGNGFAPDMYLWIYYADGSQQYDIFSPLAFDTWTSCWPLLTRLQWQPSGDIWQFTIWDWYQ